MITDVGLKELKHVPGLASLDLSFCYFSTGLGLQELKHVPGLASLHLGGSEVTDTGLKELKHVPCSQITQPEWLLRHHRHGTQCPGAYARPHLPQPDMLQRHGYGPEEADGARSCPELPQPDWLPDDHGYGGRRSFNKHLSQPPATSRAGSASRIRARRSLPQPTPPI